MRILYVCLDRGIPLGGTKGASIHMEEMLTAMEAEGHVTAVVARSALRGADRQVFEATVAQRFGWVPGSVLRRDLREAAAGPALGESVEEAIRSFRPDLAYERYALFRTEGVRAAHRSGIPVVLEVNAPLAAEERRFRGLKLVRRAGRAERSAWASADLAVAVSEPLSRRVRAAGQERVLVVPNAVDPQVFRPLPGGGVRSSLGLEERFVIGFAGSLKDWHDLPTLVRATGDLATRSPSLRPALLLIGDGPERAAVEAEARARGVELRVTGAIPHGDVPMFLAAADVCVAGLRMDSDLDYFSPLKAMEYLACGKATVVALWGDLAGLASAGVALGYRPGDPTELADRLEALASDGGARARLGRMGREHAEDRTWRAAVRAILQELDRLRSTAPRA